MDDLILVIDIQNAYKIGEVWEWKNINNIILNILKLLKI